MQATVGRTSRSLQWTVRIPAILCEAFHSLRCNALPDVTKKPILTRKGT